MWRWAFFYSGVNRSWLVMAQKCPNMAGLSTFQSGPKGSKGTKMVDLSVFDPFGLIWTLFVHFKQKLMFCSGAPPPNPTLSIWGKKIIFVWNGPNMAGLSTFQSGPKESKLVNLDVFGNLGPFWAHLDTFGPFQTKINVLPHKDKEGFGGGAFEQKIIFVWNGPKGSKWTQTGSKMIKKT